MAYCVAGQLFTSRYYGIFECHFERVVICKMMELDTKHNTWTFPASTTFFNIRQLNVEKHNCGACHLANVQRMSVCLHYFLISPNLIWNAMATSLDKSENKVQIHHLHPKRFHMVKRLRKSSSLSGDIRLNTPVFLAVSYQTFTNELCQLWSYWTKVQEIFTRYRDIIYTVNAHIKIAISNSVSECQSDEKGETAVFFTKLVAMATSLEISEKEVQIDHLHPKRFHLVKDCENWTSTSSDNCSLSIH